MKIELELPEIEGFEYTGEYRAPKKGEWFFDSGEALMETSEDSCEYPILKKIAPKYYSGHSLDDDKGVIKVVEIKALEDALALLSVESNDWTCADNSTRAALRELLK